jgi:cell division protein FtsA
MESLKIRDKKQVNVEEEEIVQEKQQPEVTANQTETNSAAQQVSSVQEQEVVREHQEQKKAARLTFGQSLMEKVKKFFEEVE